MGVHEQEGAFPLDALYVYMTGGCNLRCRHCWLAPEVQGEGDIAGSLDPALFRSIIGQAVPLGLQTVKLTGGEPLLHSAFEEMLQCIGDYGLELNMESNGVLCSREKALAVKQCSDDAFVSVSLDGADPDDHDWMRGVKGAHAAAVAGIRNLVAAGVRTQLIMTLTRRTAGQMEDLVALAHELGAESVKFNLLQPTERGQLMQERGEGLDIVDLVRIGQWVERELVPSAPLDVFFDQPVAFRSLGTVFSSTRSPGLCGILGILGVLADGSYALCGIGKNIPKLVFGHASRDALTEVWNGNPVLQELREGMPARLDGVCGECLMQGICLGSCIAQNYYASQRLWAPFWFCRQAREAGLFPESRLANMCACSK